MSIAGPFVAAVSFVQPLVVALSERVDDRHDEVEDHADDKLLKHPRDQARALLQWDNTGTGLALVCYSMQSSSEEINLFSEMSTNDVLPVNKFEYHVHTMQFQIPMILLQQLVSSKSLSYQVVD